MAIFKGKIGNDLNAIFHVTCAVFGIGSLCLATNFSQAGWQLGSAGLMMVGLFNVYASVLLCRCLLNTPEHVVTYSDLGYHVWGHFGRSAVILAQFSMSLIIPIAFLVLGGATLLPVVFKGVIDTTPNVWIPIMSATLLPVTLIRNIKEAAWCVVLGVLGALFADVLAVTQSLATQPFVQHDHRHTTALEPENVLTVFGSYSLAFGAAVVLPTIQREHPDPRRMPTAISIALLAITSFYMVVGVLGYIQFGCTSPPNLLTAMSEDGWRRAAYFFMFVHVAIALPVNLAPALYIFERSWFGINKIKHDAVETGKRDFVEITSPDAILAQGGESAIVQKVIPRSPEVKSKISVASRLSWGMAGEIDEEEEDVAYTSKQKVQSFILRTSIVAAQTILAMLLQSSFNDLVEFIGSTANAFCCTIIPCVLYWKLNYKTMRIQEKIMCGTIIVISLVLGLYTAVMSMISIVKKSSEFAPFQAPVNPVRTLEDVYQFCHKDESGVSM